MSDNASIIIKPSLLLMSFNAYSPSLIILSICQAFVYDCCQRRYYRRVSLSAVTRTQFVASEKGLFLINNLSMSKNVL